MEAEYNILLEDKGCTHNINCHTFDCTAVSKEEVVGKMYFQRPEFRTYRLRRIKSEGEEVYIDPEYKERLDRAYETLRDKMKK